MRKTTMARMVTMPADRSRTSARATVVVKTRSALDRQTKALVGKPSREAFRLLDEGKLRGTIAEVELKMLRYLTA